MSRPLSDIARLPPSFWRRVGNWVVRAIREETRDGRGVDGQAFGAYTPGYAKRKAEGAFRRQASQSTAPNLILTGDMDRDLQVLEADGGGVKVGWPSQGAKVLWNEASGRAVTTDRQPLSDTVLARVMRDIELELGRNAALSSGTLRLRIKVG